jgi:hypothetical protein
MVETPAPVWESARVDSAPVVQQISVEAQPMVQRVVGQPQAVQREAEVQPQESVSTQASSPAAPAAAAAPPETDELVKKLFDPLLRRLKTELRLDRERRGALTDRPH